MIVTCPQCDARFVVPSTVFMRGGRKMKCGSCTHKWFHEAPEDQSEAVASFAENLSQAKPAEKTKKSLNFNILKIIKNEWSEGKKIILAGFVSVLIIFACIHFLSTPSLIMGQGLAFHNVEMKRDQGNLIVTGEIINSMKDDRGVPQIQITQILGKGIFGDMSIHKLEKDVLSSEEVLPISITLNNIDSGVQELKIGFQGDGQSETNH